MFKKVDFQVIINISHKISFQKKLKRFPFWLQNTTSLYPNELQKLSAISTPYQELKVPIWPLVLSTTLGAKSKREQAELVSQGLLQP